MLKKYEPELLEKLHNAEMEVLKELDSICRENNINYFPFAGTAIGAVRHNGFIPWDDDIDLGMLREDYEKFYKIVKSKKNYDFRITTPYEEPYYCSTMIKFQQNDTMFVPPYAEKEKAKLGIHVDIFVFDNIADEKKEAIKQIKRARFYTRLMFLRNYSKPVIEGKGLIVVLQKLACRLIHYVLSLFRVSPKWMYKQYLKNATKYNDRKTKYVSTFQTISIAKCRIRKKDMFPLVDMRFESIEMPVMKNYHEYLTKIIGDYMTMPPENERVNHAPIILKFKGEDIMYL